MELLRRSLLLGCLLPGLWLLNLTFLEPVVTVLPAPDGVQARRGSGPGWDALTKDLDALAKGAIPPRVEGRVTSLPPGPERANFVLFVPASDRVLGPVLWDLGAWGATTYLAGSGPDGSASYRLEPHTWTNGDFGPGVGFTGQPRPPDSILYPLRLVGVALMLAGVALFTVLPGGIVAEGSMPVLELLLLAGVAVFFYGPLLATGGSVQALTRAPWLTIPSWILSAACLHLFARPRLHLRLQLLPAEDPAQQEPSAALASPAFLRLGAVFLAIAVGPVIALVGTSLALWNR
jgi:hypothetical protein